MLTVPPTMLFGMFSVPAPCFVTMPFCGVMAEPLNV